MDSGRCERPSPAVAAPLSCLQPELVGVSLSHPDAGKHLLHRASAKPKHLQAVCSLKSCLLPQWTSGKTWHSVQRRLQQIANKSEKSYSCLWVNKALPASCRSVAPMALTNRLVRLGRASARNAVQINKGCPAAPRAATSLPSMTPRAGMCPVKKTPCSGRAGSGMLWNSLVLLNPDWAGPSAQSKQALAAQNHLWKEWLWLVLSLAL